MTHVLFFDEENVFLKPEAYRATGCRRTTRPRPDGPKASRCVALTPARPRVGQWPLCITPLISAGLEIKLALLPPGPACLFSRAENSTQPSRRIHQASWTQCREALTEAVCHRLP